MIPELTLDIDSINYNWKESEDREWAKKYCDVITLNRSLVGDNYIPIYQCDNNWVDLGVFKEFKKCERIPIKYGYCDREEDLYKFLQSYKEDKDNNYFIECSLMNMHYEKYYKNGVYINKDGENTHEDYYPYIDQNPNYKVDQQYPGYWIAFSIYKLL